MVRVNSPSTSASSGCGSTRPCTRSSVGRAGVERGKRRLEPTRSGFAVVVGEGDDRRARRSPTGVALRHRTALEDLNGLERKLALPPMQQRLDADVSVVHDDHFEIRDVLGREAPQGAFEQLDAVDGGHDHRDARGHGWCLVHDGHSGSASSIHGWSSERTTSHGTPDANTPAGMSLLTTELGPTIDQGPIVTPRPTDTRGQMNVLRPMSTAANLTFSPTGSSAVVWKWVESAIVAYSAMIAA